MPAVREQPPPVRPGVRTVVAAVITSVVAAVVVGAGPVAEARAGAPSAPLAAEPEGRLPVPPAEPSAPPRDDRGETVAAVVVGPDGAEVVSVRAAPSRVRQVTAALAGAPDVVDVFLDSPVGLLADPLRPQQWHLDALHLADLPPGTPDGSGMRVAVLDTGVDAGHPDLAGRVRCDLGADFSVRATSSSGSGCTDPHGHGTHVAGTVAALSGNGLGVAGVSAAEVIPVRVLGANGWGTSAGISAGILHAVDSGADVLNLSIGGDAAGDFDAAVRYALDRGVVVVAAAGNNRLQGNRPQYPGATPGVIAVAATDRLGLSAEFSHSGPANLIAAPGAAVTSTVPGGYEVMSGTSMAAPHVAGVVARYRALHPTATPADVRAALAATATDLERPGFDPNTGHGLVDVHELLTGVQLPPPPERRTPPAAPVLGAVSAGPRSVTARWAAPGWDGGAPVEAYGVDVWRLRSGALDWVRTVPVAAGARSATVGGLANGSVYLVSVFAENALGEGQWSALSGQLRPRSVPAAPRIGSPSAAAGGVTVRWSAPGDTGGAAVTGYTVTAYQGSTVVRTATAAGGAREVRVGGLGNGTAYTFVVSARNDVGAGPASARSAAVTPRTTPGAPRIRSVAARSGGLRVRWAAPGSTGGAAVTSYLVSAYRGSTLVASATVPGRSREATLTGLRREAHTVTVTAVNAAGKGAASARSEPVTPRR